MERDALESRTGTAWSGTSTDVARGTAGVAAPLLLGFGVSFVLSVVLARRLGAAQFGAFAYVLSCVTVLGAAALFGVDVFLARDIPRHYATAGWGQLRGAVRWANAGALGASAVVAIIGAVAGARLPGLTRGSVAPAALLIAAALVPLTAMTRVQQATLRGLHRPGLSQVPEVLVHPALMLALVLASTAVRPLTVTSALAAHAVTLGVALAVAAWYVRRSLPTAARSARPRYESRLWIVTSFHFFLLGALNALNGRVDLLTLGAFAGPAPLGQYAAAVRGAGLVPLALGFVVVAVMPRLVSAYVSGDSATTRRLVRQMRQVGLIGGLPVAAVMILTGRQFLGLFGAEFEGAAPALAILGLGQLVNIAAGPVATVLITTGHERDAVAGVAASVAANALLCLLLIPRWGLNGAAAAAAISLALWNAVLWWRVRARLAIGSGPARGTRRQPPKNPAADVASPD